MVSWEVGFPDGLGIRLLDLMLVILLWWWGSVGLSFLVFQHHGVPFGHRGVFLVLGLFDHLLCVSHLCPTYQVDRS